MDSREGAGPQRIDWLETTENPTWPYMGEKAGLISGQGRDQQCSDTVEMWSLWVGILPQSEYPNSRQQSWNEKHCDV